MEPRAKRSLGQNFLRDPSVVDRIVAELEIGPDDHVIEIGPGTGVLTEAIAQRAAQTTALEFDRDLIDPLRHKFAENANVEIVEGDALSVDLEQIFTKPPIKLAANLPYNISTAILQRLIDHRQLIDRCVLMFQREVVDRITAQPGTKDRGYLTVLVEDAFDVKKLFDVPPGAFVPSPKVWSSVARLDPRIGEMVDNTDRRRVISLAFAQKRKTLGNNLKTHFPDVTSRLGHIYIDANRRAETLTLDEWRRITLTLAD